MAEYLKIPLERIPVLIGKKGEVKKKIEETAGVELKINTKDGSVIIEKKEGADPFKAWKVRDVVRAIGRGFCPEKALKLLEEDYYLEIIELADYTSVNENNLKRVRGRLIGKEGRARKTIEELADVSISIYGKTVAIIGTPEDIELARRAIIELIRGKRHSTVYRFLERERKRLKMERLLHPWMERE